MTELERNAKELDDSALPWRMWLTVLLIAFGLFSATANRGAQWQDPGSHILSIVTGEILNHRGLALTHPLHYWLGRVAIWPNLIEPCLAITLLSALAAAVAVANVGGCVLTLTKSKAAAILSCASLAFANTFWQLATRAEIYTLSAALFAGECWCLAAYAVRRHPAFLLGIFLLNGLGVANHMQATLTTPILAAIVLHQVFTKRIGWSWALLAGVLWSLCTLPYTGLVIAELNRTGDWVHTLRSALFGHRFAEQVMNTSVTIRMFAVSVGFGALSFPNLLIPAAVLGFIKARSIGVPALAKWGMVAGFVVHVCFVVRFDVLDSYTFFLPLYVLLAIFGGIGCSVMPRWRHQFLRRLAWVVGMVFLGLTPVFYAVFPMVARKFDMLESVLRNKPYRDDYVYVFIPWSVAENSAQKMSQKAVELAGDAGLILVEDRMAEPAIRYRALRANAKNVTITGDAPPESIVATIESNNAVVLVPLDVDAPQIEAPIGSWGRVGDLYVLVRETSAQ